MVTIIVKQRVKDFPRWKEVLDNLISRRRSFGETKAQLLANNTDPNEAIGIFEWDSLEKARTFFYSREFREAMKEAGMAYQPDIYQV